MGGAVCGQLPKVTRCRCGKGFKPPLRFWLLKLNLKFKSEYNVCVPLPSPLPLSLLCPVNKGSASKNLETCPKKKDPNPKLFTHKSPEISHCKTTVSCCPCHASGPCPCPILLPPELLKNFLGAFWSKTKAEKGVEEAGAEEAELKETK